MGLEGCQGWPGQQYVQVDSVAVTSPAKSLPTGLRYMQVCSVEPVAKRLAPASTSQAILPQARTTTEQQTISRDQNAACPCREACITQSGLRCLPLEKAAWIKATRDSVAGCCCSAGRFHSLSEHKREEEVRFLLAMVANAATAQSVTGVLLVVVASQVSKLSQTALQGKQAAGSVRWAGDTRWTCDGSGGTD